MSRAPSVALICGISGQDGAYLAQQLLRRGYIVWGSSRNPEAVSLEGLRKLRILESVKLIQLSPTDPSAIKAALQSIRPDHVYNLAGQTSVGLSFERPMETIQSIAIGTVNLLEGIRATGLQTRFFNPGSVEVFGSTEGKVANEESPFSPSNPYAIAKAASFWTACTFRRAYGMFVSTGILSNHESPLRPAKFVTRKIVNAAAKIRSGVAIKLNLGDLAVERDWGWAPEYVDAFVRMMERPTPGDYIIATGQTCSLRDFVKTAFDLAKLDWREHVLFDDHLRRPTDIPSIRLDPGKATRELGWTAKYKMQEVVQMMLDAEIEEIHHRKIAATLA